jgi:serine/threonine protein kinase/Tol biopolymer transport system component
MTPGQRLGSYELIERIGAGGMGEVWRALDPALGRQVAIKILPPQYSRDPDRLRRFEQEARAAGKLNHPNVLAIYAVGIHDEVPYLVTELLEGTTLRERLANGALTERKAVEYGDQIVQGLAAAHDKSIVHRDLKPENIFITCDGRVKILDFGLAKLTQSGPDGDMPTQTAHGLVLGTPGYMSPEQVRGEAADHRADIFAVGAVLYEMLSGQRAFFAGSSVETMHAVLTEDPPAISRVSPQLEQIVRHCLEKTPADRYQSARDLAFQLRLAAPAAMPEAATSSANTPRRRWVTAAALCVIALAAAGAGVTWWFTQSPARSSALTVRRLTFDSGLTTDPAFSFDGQLVAYASDRAGAGNLDIWRQQLATGEPIQLTSHPADESEPVFSPDGSRIAFRSERDGGGVYVVSTFGGEPRLIAKEGRRPRFSPDGREIAYWVPTGPVPYIGKAFVVPAVGGDPTQIEPSFASARHPLWSADGQKLLFVGAREQKEIPLESQDWWMSSRTGAPAVKTGAADVFRRLRIRDQGSQAIAPFAWVGDDVFFSAAFDEATHVWRLALPAATGVARTNAERVTSGTSVETKPSVSADGRIVFASLKQDVNIWSLPIGGDGVANGELQQVTGSAFDAHTSLSADGTKLVFVSTRSGNRDVWLKNLVSGAEIALTASSLHREQPEITADGSRVAYWVFDGTRAEIHQLAIAGGLPEKLCDACGRPWDWSPDGRRLLYLIPEGSKAPGLALGMVDVATREKTVYAHPDFGLARARFSPDGHWVSFTVIPVDRAAPNRIVIAPFPEGLTTAANRWIVAAEERSALDKSRWSADGSLLYYTSEADGFRCIRARRLDASTKEPVGPPIDVYHSHNARRSLTNPWLGFLELSIGAGKLFFNFGETTGNIWMAESKPRSDGR